MDGSVEIDIKGKRVRVCGVEVEGNTVVVRGRAVKWAYIYDEEWLEDEPVKNPEWYVRELCSRGLKADIFSFTRKFSAQNFPQTEPKFPYRFVWDNRAVVRLTTFDEWWANDLPQVSRKNVRRARKRGVTVEEAVLDDALIRGITDIYNDTPVRQGKRFPYYGKSADEIREEISAFSDRSIFLAAFHENEIIGFAKIVKMGCAAGLLHLLSKREHDDKRTNNALIAAAVEACCREGLSLLSYGRYVYGNKTESSLTTFKDHNGFKRIDVPKYFVPLTARGHIALALGAHRGLVGLLPLSLLKILNRARAWIYGGVRAGFRAARSGTAGAARPGSGEQA